MTRLSEAELIQIEDEQAVEVPGLVVWVVAALLFTLGVCFGVLLGMAL